MYVAQNKATLLQNKIKYDQIEEQRFQSLFPLIVIVGKFYVKKIECFDAFNDTITDS